MEHNRPSLAHPHDLTPARLEGAVVFGPKAGMRAKLLEAVGALLAAGG